MERVNVNERVQHNNLPLGLSLLDFVPNLAFLAGAYFLVRLLLLRNRSFSMFVMIAGSSLVFLGGTSKAIWKLLYTIGIGDNQLLSELQFVLLAPGFLMMLVSVFLLAKQERRMREGVVVAMAAWKIPLLAITTMGTLGVLGILSYLAFLRKAHLASVLYIVAVLCMLGMAGMAGGEINPAEAKTKPAGQPGRG